jgi:hypothetical protein
VAARARLCAPVGAPLHPAAPLPRHDLRPATTSDLSAVEHERELPPHVLQVARELQRPWALAPPARVRASASSGARCCAATRTGSGGGAGRGRPACCSPPATARSIAPESGVVDGEYLVALDVQAGRRGEAAEARIRMASLVERDWLTATTTRPSTSSTPQAGRVRAMARVLRRHRPGGAPASPGPAAAAALLRDAYLARGLESEDEQLVRRLAFAGNEIGHPDALVARAVAGSHRARRCRPRRAPLVG